jgi:hypothetical protein
MMSQQHETIAVLVSGLNIRRYRNMLNTPLEEVKRQTIQTLLREEEVWLKRHAPPFCTAAGHRPGAEQRDELASFQLVELHSVPASQGPVADYSIGKDQSAGTLHMPDRRVKQQRTTCTSARVFCSKTSRFIFSIVSQAR